MKANVSSEDQADPRPELRIPAAAVSRGIGIGHAVFLDGTQRVADKSDLAPTQIENEIERFRSAVRRAGGELTNLIASDKAGSPESASGIFGVHLLILEGSSFITNIESLIHDQRANADWAVREVAKDFAERQKSVADDHLRDKYLDVQDVADRIIQALGAQTRPDAAAPGSVLIVSELMPSRLMDLAKSGPTAVISEHGGWTSHTSILARELKLPVVTGVKNIGRVVSVGDAIIVDGFDGQIIIRPTQDTINHFVGFSNTQQASNEIPAADENPLRTLDGHEITIRANADLPYAYQIGARSGAKGIGLYRSEVILSQFRRFPAEAEQTAVYRQIAKLVGDAGVRIRTFDISADQIDGREAARERNPSLGLRSIRLSLTDPSHFRTQVRAILQAAHQNKVDIVLPMISGVFDVLRLIAIIDDERASLQKEGILIGDPRIGAMIEIPSAVMTAVEIARHVDFLCLGTNDLVQYLLAVDRDNETVAGWYQTLHPAVIRAIDEVIAAGNNAGIPVAICGEIAGSAFYVPLLIGIGARELSMNVNSIPQIRRLISGIAVTEAAQLVESIKKYETADEIEGVLRAHYLKTWNHLFPAGLLSSKYPQ